LGDVINFKIPDGGMAIWVKFDKRFPLSELSKKVASKGLYLSDGQAYGDLNACRMGFASMNLKEIEEAVGILKSAIHL
jgi:GntR family transcriptional regulator/MocR family aminotransferase